MHSKELLLKIREQSHVCSRLLKNLNATPENTQFQRNQIQQLKAFKNCVPIPINAKKYEIVCLRHDDQILKSREKVPNCISRLSINLECKNLSCLI